MFEKIKKYFSELFIRIKIRISLIFWLFMTIIYLIITFPAIFFFKIENNEEKQKIVMDKISNVLDALEDYIKTKEILENSDKEN